MDVTPTGTTPRRPRTKVVAKEPTAAKPVRKPAASRKKSTETAVTVEAAQPQASADLHSMIEMAAFYLAAERSFAPGHELDDWLEAERRIRARSS